jgi:Putative DNA-binding domain
MSDLARLQRDVQKHVLAGDAAARAHVVGTRPVPVTTRLKIYREGYYLRLAEALATTYSALHALLGEDQFRRLARRYIDAHPSRHYSVRYFGHRLAPFLARQEPYRSMPMLTELARWEWAMADVFDAFDATPFTPAALAQMPPDRWPTLTFCFHTAVRVVATRWNVAEIWSALTRDSEPPQPVRSDRIHHWALWRTGLDIFFAPLEIAEERALRAALRGEPFADICARAPRAEGEDRAALWAAGTLRQWVERGWILRVQRAEEVPSAAR